MKYLNKALLIFACFTWISVYSQKQNVDLDINPNTAATAALPKISKDSTNAEVTAHVIATIEWMTSEHYKSSYVPTLIYADKAIYLAKKTGNNKYVYETRTIVGNTMLRVNDTTGAKKIFIKSLNEAKKSKDSSAILESFANLASFYYYSPNYKYKTIEKYLESVPIAEQLKDTARSFAIHHNLAKVLNELNQPENSSFHIKQSENYLNQLGSPPHFKASHLHNEGRMYLLLNKPDKAIDRFKQTIAICENTDYVDALIEGYEGYKDALEMKKDYKGVYDINKKLEVYDEKKDKDEAKNIADAVSANLNVERYKDQIKSKELEKRLLEQTAKRKNILFVLVLGIVIFLIIIMSIAYFAHKNRKVLVKDLQAKNKQYLIAKEESEQLTKAKERFFATISHELRTPLYGVIGLSSILMESNELKKHEKDLKSLKFSADYLLALINDLLQMNKIDNKSFTKEQTTFNLREQVNTIASSFEYIRLQHGNKIRISISDNLPVSLKGNSVMLSQILMNLIGNACKFTENGIIDIIVNTISTENETANIEFIVRDNGPGIEKNKLKGIFDEFTQISSSTNAYQGTGLGLPIVKKLLKQSGSSITVKSELGAGSEFKFSLLLKVISQHEETTRPLVLDTGQLSQKSILIVEDNRINQTVTRKILETENVNCDIAENGEIAVSMVKENFYDLVLMDINMPVKNGIEATEDIRIFNDIIPIIALTAVEVDEQKQRIFECGMNDVIVKPYDIDIFKQTLVENLLMNKREVFKKLG